jgi:hypothetical protein
MLQNYWATNMSDEEKNQKTISDLRETFTGMSQRLTPEVQPATIYPLYVPVSTSTSSEDAE